MLKYWVLVSENNQGTIVSLYSPDLKKELLVNAQEVESQENGEARFDFRSYARKRLEEEFGNRNKVLFPKRFQQLEDIPITSLQHWECFKVNSNKKWHIFEKTLPITGHIFNIVAILTNLFITFMALKIAAKNNDDNSTQSTVLAIAGSIFNSLINFFLYVASGASDILIETGSRLDNLCRKKDAPLLAEHNNLLPSKKQTFKFVALSLTAGGCILANSFIAAVRQYMEYTLLTDKYLGLNPNLSETEQEEYFKLIKSLVILPNIIAVSYTQTAFQGSFARKLIANLTDKTKHSISPYSESSTLINRLNHVTHTLSLSPAGRIREESAPFGSSTPSFHQFRGAINYQPLDQSEGLSVVPNGTAKTQRISVDI